MSGIVGLLRWDGEHVDATLLKGMTDSLALRGPDAQHTWTNGPVGFGHALLRTSEDSLNESQPKTFDGEVWITADVRMDARDEIIRGLRSSGRPVGASLPDVELLLHAYHAWGEGLLERVFGDFSFAIWDGRSQSLFCAHDQFAVRPFYYARTDHCLVFSNSLTCVRLHPDVPEELNELAIADFLMIGANADPATTSFAGIQRLPPAHSLTCHVGNVRVRRYWTFPIEEPLRYKRRRDYPERFRELLRVAVADRLRTRSVGVTMTGGLDSTSVAATARDLLGQRPDGFDLRAVCVVFDKLIRDDERLFASLVAQKLGIPIHFIAWDDCASQGDLDSYRVRTPEPMEGIFTQHISHLYAYLSKYTRVYLTGQGGDAGLVPSLRGYLGWGAGRLLWGILQFCLTHGGRHPRLGFRIAWNRWRGKQQYPLNFPIWLNKELVVRLHLRERWNELVADPLSSHPYRPEAYGRLQGAFFQRVFETHEPEFTGFPLEARHPLFDARLMRFMLRLPPLPWCVEKEIVRQAMHGLLPAVVLERPKTPLTADPEAAKLQTLDWSWKDALPPASDILHFVDIKGLSMPALRSDPEAARLLLRSRSLFLWLQFG